MKHAIAVALGVMIAVIAYAIFGQKLTTSAKVVTATDTGTGSAVTTSTTGSITFPTAPVYNDPTTPPQTYNPITGQLDQYIWDSLGFTWVLTGIAVPGDARQHCIKQVGINGQSELICFPGNPVTSSASQDLSITGAGVFKS